jgi:hypothetical protein
MYSFKELKGTVSEFFYYALICRITYKDVDLLNMVQNLEDM